MAVALIILYLAIALAALMVGAGALWAAWQVSQLVKHVRQVMLPQANLILTEVQRSLNQVETLTQEVSTTIDEANQVVHQVNRGVEAVETSVTNVSHTLKNRVAKPVSLRAQSTWQGLKAGWRVLRRQESGTARLRAPALDQDEDHEAAMQNSAAVV